MKTFAAIIFFGLIIIISGCAGAYVGVGVHTPGPWGGPYSHPRGGGTVIIGRPMPGGYMPYLHQGRPALAAHPLHDQE